MGNCLITTLKGGSNNPQLDKLNQIRFTSPEATPNAEVASYILNRNNNMYAEIISGNGTFKVDGVDKGASYTIPAGDGLFYIVHNDDKPVIYRVDDFAKISSLNNAFTDLDRLFIYNNEFTAIQMASNYDFTEETKLVKLTTLSNLPITLQSLVLYKSTVGFLHDGSLSDIARCTSLQQVIIIGNKIISGQISELAPCVNLDALNLTNQRIEGTIESLGSAMAQNRSSGVLTLRLSGNNVTVRGEKVPYTCDLRFGSDMVNPSSEETAQGYQIA